MSERASLTASLRERYIDHAHEGNGTGCRCCELVDDGILTRLIDEPSVQWWKRTCSVPRWTVWLTTIVAYAYVIWGVATFVRWFV